MFASDGPTDARPGDETEMPGTIYCWRSVIFLSEPGYPGFFRTRLCDSYVSLNASVVSHNQFEIETISTSPLSNPATFAVNRIAASIP